MTDIHVMHWNCQGITTNSAITQLENFIRNKNIDVVLLNETFLKPHHKIKIGGFKIYRRDRISHGGGVLMAVRNTIDHCLLPFDRTDHIENLSISISVNQKTVILTSAYSPRYTTKFSNDISVLTSKTKEFFIFGDFNALHTSWNCSSNNSAGKVLYNRQNQSDVYIHFPLNFTRFSQQLVPRLPSTVDLLLSNSSLPISALETHPDELESDHVPITCHIFGSVLRANVPKIPLYHMADWVYIRSWVEKKLQNLSTIELTHNNFELIINKVVDILKRAKEKVPIGEIITHERCISFLALRIIRQRNRIRRKFKRCSDRDRRQSLLTILKQLNRFVDFYLNRDRNERWSNFIQKLPAGRKKFWKISKTLKGKRASIPTLSVNGVKLSTCKSKADAIADVFEQAHVITVNDRSTLDSKVAKIVNQVRNACNDTLEASMLTNGDELIEYVKEFKNNKAPGQDSISNTLLKNMPSSLFGMLANIFNFLLLNGIFPQIFKTAKVIPIHKKGKDPKSPSSYRPISLLSSIDKLFEKVIYRRILNHTENYQVINCKQFGFRRQHSTVHQIKRVVNMIEHNKHARRSTGVILLDIEKAFDTVWHDGLVYKMNNLRYPLYLQKIIASFLKNRSFKVCISNEYSESRSLPAGLPQGSVLSPLLYSIFTYDISIKRNHDAAFYADDSALICSGKVSNAIVKQLGQSIKHVEKYFKKWKIKINHEKTQAIIFPYNKSPKRVPSIPLQFLGNVIELKSSIKYLGVTLDSKLTFGEHIRNSCEKATNCGRALFPLLNRKSKLNQINKCLLYRMCIKPIMTYACQVWFTKTAKCHLRKLQIIQNKNLKIIHNLPWRYPTQRLHSFYGHRSMNMAMRILTLSFEERCRRSEYEIIRNLI